MEISNLRWQVRFGNFPFKMAIAICDLAISISIRDLFQMELIWVTNALIGDLNTFRDMKNKLRIYYQYICAVGPHGAPTPYAKS